MNMAARGGYSLCIEAAAATEKVISKAACNFAEVTEEVRGYMRVQVTAKFVGKTAGIFQREVILEDLGLSHLQNRASEE